MKPLKNVFVYEVVLANVHTGKHQSVKQTIATNDPNKLLDLAVNKFEQSERLKVNKDHWRAFASVKFLGFAALDPDA